MQIVSHEMSNPTFWEKQEKNIISLSSAEFTQRVAKANDISWWLTIYLENCIIYSL